MDAVIWHDVECGSYDADLELWRTLADEQAGPVLDLGAGTGRVALDLARAGHEVVALDVEEAFLAALRERAGSVPVETVVADASDFDLGRTFALVLAPMQTVQLLGGPAARASMLRSIRRHVEPGGLFAAAVVNVVEVFGDFEAPVPDMREVAGVVYASRPVAVRSEGGTTVVERVRERIATDGERTVTDDVIRLDRLSAELLAQEARAHGFTAEQMVWIPETDDHVGSEVAMLRA